MKAMAWGTLPLLVLGAFRRYLQAVNAVRPIFWTAVSANLVNWGANWLLIRGHWGLPAMGVEGSGWSTTLARVYMAAAMAGAAVLLERKDVRAFWRVPLGVDWGRMARLVRLGLPAATQIGRFLCGLAGVGERKLIITMPNADAGAEAIRAALTAFADARPDRVVLVESLGARRYAAALTACDAVVGNSSSGVIEAPAAGVPSVNVGDRQAGRLKPSSVIDSANTPDALAEAVARALDPAFREAARLQAPPFGDGRAAERIVTVLEATDFAGLARKPFVDRG